MYRLTQPRALPLKSRQGQRVSNPHSKLFMSLFGCAELMEHLSGKCLPGKPGAGAVDSLRGACVNRSVAELRRNCPNGVQLSRKFTVVSIIPNHLTMCRVEISSQKQINAKTNVLWWNLCLRITTCPTEIFLELKKVLRRNGSPHPLCPFTSFPSPYSLNYTEINPRFLICLRLIAQGRHECQGVIDAGNWGPDAGYWILDTG